MEFLRFWFRDAKLRFRLRGLFRTIESTQTQFAGLCGDGRALLNNEEAFRKLDTLHMPFIMCDDEAVNVRSVVERIESFFKSDQRPKGLISISMRLKQER